MSGTSRQKVRGRIIIVQEQFFRLVTDSGRGLLLTLGVFARSAPEELIRFRDERTVVEVEYEGEPGYASGKAHAVRPL